MLERLPLPLKLGLVLALAVALSTALVAISVHAVVRQRFEDYVAHEMTVRGDEMRPLLEAHFSARQNWQEVESALLTETARGHGHGMRPGMGPGTARLLLVDATGMVRYDPMRARTETTLSQAELVGAAPIIVRGQTVGYLVPQTGDQEVSFQQRLLTTIVSAGAISAVLAIALGAVLSRTALQPLTQLEKATARLGSGDLSARVSVQSQDEIGRLGSRFNRMAAALEENEEHRKRLMNDIAHELRTPLTVMQGQLEALQDGIFPLNDDSLRPVYEQTLLLNRLVDDLRDLALAEAGQMALDMTMVQPEPLMRRTADRFAQAAERQQLKLDLVLGEDLPTIHADAQRLEQVLGNLLSNAIRHTPSGGLVSLAAHRTETGVRIIVEDTGEGISPEDLDRIFERFYRGDRARERSEGHAGLGLAIASQLARAHGGELGVQSEAGKGASFSLDLPAGSATDHGTL